MNKMIEIFRKNFLSIRIISIGIVRMISPLLRLDGLNYMKRYFDMYNDPQRQCKQFDCDQISKQFRLSWIGQHHHEKCSICQVVSFIELILFLVNMFQMFQCAMLLSCSVSAPFQVFHNTLKHLNQKFYAISENSRIGKPIGANELGELRFIYRQHNILCYYEIFTDKDAWSQALYYYALVSIPVNVTLLCIIIVEDLPGQLESVYILITLIHAITGLIPFLTAAQVSSAFHKIKDYIPAMQIQLNRSTDLRMKLKYDDLYERLMFGKKIAFTFGYLGDLTYRGLFEAFLGYFVAFFLIMGFYMKEHQDQARN